MQNTVTGLRFYIWIYLLVVLIYSALLIYSAGLHPSLLFILLSVPSLYLLKNPEKQNHQQWVRAFLFIGAISVYLSDTGFELVTGGYLLYLPILVAFYVFESQGIKNLTLPGTLLVASLVLLGMFVYAPGALLGVVAQKVNPGVIYQFNLLLAVFLTIYALHIFNRLRKQSVAALNFKEANFLALMKNDKDPIWCIDKNYQLISFNGVFAYLFRGMWNKEAKDGVSILFPEHKHEIYKNWNSWHRRAMNGETFTFDTEFMFRDGVKSYEITFTPIQLGSATEGIVVKAIDITTRKAEAIKLQQQSIFLNKLIAHLPIGIFVKNVKQGLTYTLWNKGMEEVFGVSEQNVLGKTDEEIFEGSTQIVPYIETDQLVLEDKEPLLIQKLKVELGKHEIFARAYKIPLLDANGNVELILGIVENITETIKQQQELETAEKRWNYALSGSRDAVWDVDLINDETFFSPMLNDILGYELAEKLPGSWEELVHPEDVKNAWNRFVDHLEGKTAFYEEEYRMRKKDGSYIWILDRGKIAETDSLGNPTRVIGTFSNINYRKQLEKEHMQALEKAQEASRAKSLFLSTMSHEIRTPMNGIIGIINLMLGEELKAEQRENLEALKYSADNLLFLLNDILDFSKIDAGKMDLELGALNLTDLAQNNLKAFIPRANEKGIRLQLKVSNNLPKTIMGDVLRLNQIISNLISNAIKFTERGSVVLEMLVKEKTEKEATITFSVTDTGIGIAKEFLPHLFEQFTQASTDTTRKFGGTGLGLAICKSLVEIMGGTLSVESTEGQGTTFQFSLKFQIPDEEFHQTQHLQTSKLSNIKDMRILLVEDNQMNVFVAKKFLQRWQIRTEVASNGREAVEWCRKKKFDLILMDLQMPEMDGFEATKKIRTMGIQTPIFALTANVNAEAKKQVMECGMNDYISKPFNPDELFEKMAEYYKGKQEPLPFEKPVEGDLNSLL